MSYEFADRLVELRRQKGLSQEELAGELGLSRQAVSKWERAESAPDIGNLMALANLYGVTLDELVRGEGPLPEALDTTDEEPVESDAPAPEAATVTQAAAYSEADATPYERTYGEASNPSAPVPPAATGGASAGADAPEPNPAPTAPVNPAAQPPAPAAAPAAPKPRRNPLWTFPYPLAIVLIYVVLGFCFGFWHPTWVLFLTIPFYYWIVSIIVHDPEYKARHDERTQG